MAGPAGEIVGIRDFRRELRGVGVEWPRELRKAFKTIADKGRDLSRDDARRMGGIFAAAAMAIKARADTESASVFVSPTRAIPFANVAFWGVKPEHHLGWYGARRYDDSGSQHLPPWVGNQWDAATPGEGPYAINAALARYAPDALDELDEMIGRIAHDAFPEP